MKNRLIIEVETHYIEDSEGPDMPNLDVVDHLVDWYWWNRPMAFSIRTGAGLASYDVAGVKVTIEREEKHATHQG